MLELILADGTTHPHTGTLQKVDREIDVKSGAITVEASFANPNKLLRPGLFAKVRTIAVTRPGVLVIPKKAVRELQGRQQVSSSVAWRSALWWESCRSSSQV